MCNRVGFCITAAAAGTRKTALPTSAGIGALRSEFSEAVADEAGGYALDYCYYSPVGQNDTSKYPVVIFLHGIGHGDYPGSQLEDSYMPYWASKELQSRFTSGGAFIVLLVDKALADGMRGMAVTDHGNMFGIKDFFDYCCKVNGKRKKEGLEPFKPIFGCEMYVARRGDKSLREIKQDQSGWHLVVLAKNEKGYHNLVKLVSRASRSFRWRRFWS